MHNSQFSIPGLMDLQTPASDRLPTITKLAAHSVVDTLWVGIPTIGPITENGDPMGSPAASARMEFSRSADGSCPQYTLSTTPAIGVGTIIIEGAPTNWLFSVPAQTLPLPVGVWYWTFRVADTNTAVRLIYRGTIIVTV